MFAQRSGSEKPAYLNPALSIEVRVDDLISRMTLEERASQVVHQAKAIPRLGVPAYNWASEALHGVVTDHVTVFPEPKAWRQHSTLRWSVKWLSSLAPKRVPNTTS